MADVKMQRVWALQRRGISSDHFTFSEKTAEEWQAQDIGNVIELTPRTPRTDAADELVGAAEQMDDEIGKANISHFSPDVFKKAKAFLDARDKLKAALAKARGEVVS